MKIELYMTTKKALFPRTPQDIENCGNLKCCELHKYLKETQCTLLDYDHTRGAMWRCVIDISESDAQHLYHQEAV